MRFDAPAASWGESTPAPATASAPASIASLRRTSATSRETALLLEALPAGGRCRIVTCFGAVQAARAAALGGLLLAAMLPVEFAALAVLPLAAVLGICRRAARLVLFSLVSPVAKTAAVATVLVAPGLPSPIRSAVAVVPALEIAALLPLAPANVGLASGAAALALHGTGLAASDAVSAGIVLHAVETAAGVSYGTAAAMLCLAQLSRRRRVGQFRPFARPARDGAA